MRREAFLNTPVKTVGLTLCIFCSLFIGTIYFAVSYAQTKLNTSTFGLVLQSFSAAPSHTLINFIETSVGSNRHVLIDLANDIQHRVIFQDDGIGFIVDTSRDGEISYLLRRIKHPKRKGREAKYEKLVVDIGANDGFLSSNSYPLVQLGWSTVLIEPNPRMMTLAKRSQQLFVDPYNDKEQSSCYINAGMTGGTESTKMSLELSDDSVAMESTLKPGKLRNKEDNDVPQASSTGNLMEVDVLTVAAIVELCPGLIKAKKRFGLLSVDAEGVGDKVLYAWMKAGYRPEYIVYESMHNEDPFWKTRKILEEYNYRFMKTIGFNRMFEYEGNE
jgi:hypothetical protein